MASTLVDLCKGEAGDMLECFRDDIFIPQRTKTAEVVGTLPSLRGHVFWCRIYLGWRYGSHQLEMNSHRESNKTE